MCLFTIRTGASILNICVRKGSNVKFWFSLRLVCVSLDGLSTVLWGRGFLELALSPLKSHWSRYRQACAHVVVCSPQDAHVSPFLSLSQSLRNCLDQSEAFGPLDLLHDLEKQGQELGLIVDLTFTTRYYKPQVRPLSTSEFSQEALGLPVCSEHSSPPALAGFNIQSVFRDSAQVYLCKCVCVQDLPDTWQYVKIFTAGHEVPSDATILSFKKAVRRFLRKNENNGENTLSLDWRSSDQDSVFTHTAEQLPYSQQGLKP